MSALLLAITLAFTTVPSIAPDSVSAAQAPSPLCNACWPTQPRDIPLLPL